MLVRTHSAVALLSGLLLQNVTRPTSLLLYYAVILVGALLPDIDHPESTINRHLWITKIVPLFVSHRGILHTVWPVIFMIFIIKYSPAIIMPLLVGYVSHLFIDCFTKKGIALLSPFIKWKLRGPVKTGSWSETIFFIGICIIILALMWGRIH